MGTYRFERWTGEGAGRDAGVSLGDDVAAALREIDWVESFAMHLGGDIDEVVGVDVVFDEQWPDIRTSNPGQVAEVFKRLGLRTIADPSLSVPQVSADDPLGTGPDADDDADGFDLFEFEDDDEELPRAASN